MTGAVFLMGLAAIYTERAARAGTAGLVVPEPAIAAIGRLVAGAAVLFILALVRP